MTLATNTRIIVGLSGGVDSSVAALLLLRQGFLVEGLFMKNWEEDDGTAYCTSKEDLADAQAVCKKLNIKLHTANFAAEYWDNVFEHFLEEYRLGRTPNPDILCNKEIKFKVFLAYALELGADFIATGHYCKRVDYRGDSLLAKAADSNKDQSYFLHALSEPQIAKTLFPLGELQKTEVRKIAKNTGLLNHNKKDSTGICFIGERRYRDFLKNYIPASPGTIRTLEGTSIGTHSGLMFYTIGQRQGLGIGGIKGSSEAPWYVVDKDLQSNTLIVTQGENHPSLFSSSLYCSEIHWISSQAPNLPALLTAKVRYRQQEQKCTLSLSSDANGYQVLFEKPQRAVTLGQYVVFYQDQMCLGGGVIEARSKDHILKKHAYHLGSFK